jgi:hypothetical protein
VRAGLRVAYAGLSYRTAALEAPATEAVCWGDEIEFMPHLRKLLALRGFEAGLVFGGETVQAGDRKSLAKQLHAAVTREVVAAQDLLVVTQEGKWNSAARSLKCQPGD